MWNPPGDKTEVERGVQQWSIDDGFLRGATPVHGGRHPGNVLQQHHTTPARPVHLTIWP